MHQFVSFAKVVLRCRVSKISEKGEMLFSTACLMIIYGDSFVSPCARGDIMVTEVCTAKKKKKKLCFRLGSALLDIAPNLRHSCR